MSNCGYFERNVTGNKDTKSSQKISTHRLTVLIIGVIVHVEQRKRENKISPGKFIQKNQHFGIFPVVQTLVYVRKGDMTYVNA